MNGEFIGSLIPAFLAFTTVSSLSAAVLSWCGGALTGVIAVASIAIGSTAAVFARRTFARASRDEGLSQFERSPGADGWIEQASMLFCFAIAARHFAFLMFRVDGEVRTLSANNIGDLPLHVDMIRFIAQGAQWPLKNPIFAVETLRYPIGADLFSALFECLGAPTGSHLFWSGLFLSACLLALLRAWAGWWGIAAVFFSGGWSGWTAAEGVDWQAQVAWKNLFLATLVTQRGLLFAAPLGLFLLMRFRSVFVRNQSASRAEMMWLGFFWGALAFFHPHSFLAISVLVAGYLFIGGNLKNQTRKLGPAIALAVPVGGFWVMHSSNWLARASIARWELGWTRGSTPWLIYLGDNFGPWLIAAAVVFAALMLGPVKRDTRLRWEFLLYLKVFALFFNLILAPWPWDNVKLLIWPFLGFAAIAQRSIQPLLRSRLASPRAGPRCALWVGAATAGAAIIMSAAGVRALVEASANNLRSVHLYSMIDVAKTQGAVAKIPIDAVFIAKPSYDHALLYTGRARVAGFDGHLWSHGISYQPTMALVESVLKGDDNWRSALSSTRATHIFWGPGERAAYGPAVRPWQTIYANVSGVPEYDVYDLSRPADANKKSL